jgi:ATP-binding cassette subfamily B protein
VAHRMATITLADDVIYLEAGRVVAHGSHDRLLAEVDGYRELVTAYQRDAERRAAEELAAEELQEAGERVGEGAA